MTPRGGTRLVLIPGLGADERLFTPQRAAFPRAEVPAWIAHEPGDTLRSYALRLGERIAADGRRDPSAGGLVLVGESFGGMLAQEMAGPLGAAGVVLVSSCRTGKAVAPGAALLERIGRGLPDRWIAAAQRSRAVLRLGLGPAGPAELSLALAMADATPVGFLRWASRAILAWDGAVHPAAPVRHIHGARDRLIPCRRVRPDAVVPGAGHLANLTHAEEVNRFIADAADAFAPSGRAAR